jgi:hypothetical protein
VKGNAKRAYDGIEAMLAAVFDWQDKADRLVTTGDDDSDVIATHDSRGRLIELWVKPGLQRQLSLGELEDRINEAVSDNAGRAHAALNKISDEFLATVAELEERFPHPVADELGGTYRNATGGATGSERRNTDSRDAR